MSDTWYGVIIGSFLLTVYLLTPTHTDLVLMNKRLIDINQQYKAQRDTARVQRDEAIELVEQCLDSINLKQEEISPKQTLIDSTQKINLYYRNLNQFLVRYPPSWNQFKLPPLSH